MIAQRPCKHQHPYAPMRDSRGWLRCRTCHNARGRPMTARRRLERLAQYGTSDRRTLRRKPTGLLKCERCGGMFPRRAFERPSAFARRRFCSRRCGKPVHQAQIRRACQQCGAAITGKKPSKLRGRRYCSLRCTYAHVRAQRAKRPCPVCGNPIGSSPNQTCSRQCGYAYRKNKTRTAKRCSGCGKEFWPFPSRLSLGGGRFCSLLCYNSVRGKRPAFLKIACAQCGQSFRRNRVALARKRTTAACCSVECSRQYFQGPRSSAYRPGEGRQYIRGWGKLAEQVRQRDGHCCQRCRKPESENGAKLSVDHILPWRVFSEDEKHLANDPKNLASLCRSCHSWKTSRAESRWLRGDVLDFKAYEKALAL